MVKVNVGKFDRNLDIAEAYGVPLKKGEKGAIRSGPRTLGHFQF
jgi:hypothetical protein